MTTGVWQGRIWQNCLGWSQWRALISSS